MSISSAGQVSSLVPDVTRPNTPAKTQPEPATASAAPAGGAPVGAPSSVVVDIGAPAAVANDKPAAEPSAPREAKEPLTSVDITV